MKKIKWLNFSGAPAMVIAKECLGYWHGVYRPIVNDENPEFIYNGISYIDDLDMDFENPKTDYDRICGLQGPENYQSRWPTGPGVSVGIHIEVDIVTWLKDYQSVCWLYTYEHANDYSYFLNDITNNINSLNWSKGIAIKLVTGEAYLTNAAAFLAFEQMDDDMYIKIELPAGNYEIRFAEIQTENGTYMIHRLFQI